MARKKSTKETALVQLYERRLSNGGIRFYLHYTIDGEQKRELIKSIPIVFKSDRQAYEESQAVAKSIVAQRIKEIRNGELGLSNRYSNLLLSDWMYYVADKAEQRQNNVANRHTWAKTILLTNDLLKEYAGEQTKLLSVDRKFVEGFLNYLRNGYVIGRGVQNTGKNLAASTAQKRYQCLHFAFEVARKEGIININPCDQIDSKDKISVPESKRAFLTIEELRRMIDTPTESEKTRQIYLFMCFCGLRISDVKQLRWEHIQQEGGQWAIVKTQQKTQETAYIQLSQRAMEYLPERGGKRPSDLVFDDIPTEPAMNRALKTWAKKAGIEKTITLHTARHTFATTLLKKDVDLYTVSKLLGHKTIAPTQIYAKIVDKKKIDAVNTLNDI